MCLSQPTLRELSHLINVWMSVADLVKVSIVAGPSIYRMGQKFMPFWYRFLSCWMQCISNFCLLTCHIH